MDKMAPRKGSGTLAGSFDDTLDEFFGGTWPRRTASPTFKMDVKEDARQYTVEADLPGIGKENIRVELEVGQLFIRVDQTVARTDADAGRYMHRERRMTRMTRSVYLPGASGKDVTARLKDGVLTIRVPKIPPEQLEGHGKHIPIC